MTERDTLLLVHKGDHSLGYYDLESGEETGRVAVDPYPHEFAVSADGRRAYLCHFGVALAEDEGPGGDTLSVVDVPARKRVGTLACGPYRRPHGIALDAVGKVYALSEGTSNLMRFPGVNHGDDHGAPEQVQPTGGKGSHILSVTPDGTVAFSSNMVSGTVTALFPDQSPSAEPARPPVVFEVGERPEGSVLSADGTRLYVCVRESHCLAVIDVPMLRMLEPLPMPPGPVRMCLGPDGLLVVALYHERALALVHPDGRVLTSVPLPDRPISAAFHAPSGLAMASTFGDRLCLVDVNDVNKGRLARTIATRADPDPVAVVRL